MKKYLLLLLIIVTGLSVNLHTADAASKKDSISKSDRAALYTSFPALKQAEEEMQRVFRKTRAVMGEEGGGAAWLDKDQFMGRYDTDRIVLAKNDFGSPEMVAALIDFAHQRSARLRALAAEGRVVELQIYKGRTDNNTDLEDTELELWRYEGNRAKATIRSFSSTVENQCSVRSSLVQAADGTGHFIIPDFQGVVASVTNTADGYAATLTKDGVIDCTFRQKTPRAADVSPLPDAAALQAMGLTITTDADAYTAHITVTGGVADRPGGIASFAGRQYRTNKVPRTDDPTLEEVESCTLGADQSQKIRLLRNDGTDRGFVYYLETTRGLIPLDSFSDPSWRAVADNLEFSRGASVSVACNGDDQESVLIVTGEFSSGYLHIHVIRYNSLRKEWQVLRTTERNKPILVYLGARDMKVVIPNPLARGTIPQFLVQTVTGQGTQYTKQKKPPSSAKYRVLQGL